MHHRGFGNLKKIGCTKNGLSKKKKKNNKDRDSFCTGWHYKVPH